MGDNVFIKNAQHLSHAVYSCADGDGNNKNIKDKIVSWYENIENESKRVDTQHTDTLKEHHILHYHALFAKI